MTTPTERQTDRRESERLERLIADRVAHHDEWKREAKRPFRALRELARELRRRA